MRKFAHCVPAGSPLADEVKRFVSQEAVHSREHELYNEALARHYWVGGIEGVIWLVLGFFKCLSSTLCLAGTVGLEHLTAALGHTLVTDDEAFEGCEPHYAALWRWHAQEEVEHKAVAFDVFTVRKWGWRRWGGARHLLLGAFAAAFRPHTNALVPLLPAGCLWQRLRRVCAALRGLCALELDLARYCCARLSLLCHPRGGAL